MRVKLQDRFKNSEETRIEQKKILNFILQPATNSEIIRSKTDFIKLRTNSKKTEFVATLQKENLKTLSFILKIKEEK